MEVTHEIKCLLEIGSYVADRKPMSASLEPCFNDYSMVLISTHSPYIEVNIEYYPDEKPHGLFTVGFFGEDSISEFEDFESIKDVCDAIIEFIEKEENLAGNPVD